MCAIIFLGETKNGKKEKKEKIKEKNKLF